jgi:hypothetical protein
MEQKRYRRFAGRSVVTDAFPRIRAREQLLRELPCRHRRLAARVQSHPTGFARRDLGTIAPKAGSVSSGVFAYIEIKYLISFPLFSVAMQSGW